jgi:2-polyprenyl-3-methyl-5-hydroxy-6-metoxy-1,4-benzoquinol methylase
VTLSDGRTRAEREQKSYDEDRLWDLSHSWHSRFPHVFDSPNTLRYDRQFDETIRSHALGKRALEIGCADGLIAKRVLDFGAAYVLGIDVSHEFIGRAKRLEVPGRLEFRCADVLQTVEGTYDVIFGRSILHHIDYKEALSNLYRRNLNPGGIMVFMEPLGSNPLIKLYHLVARSAHTPDEKSFDRNELQWFTETFPGTRIHPFNLLSFVTGLGSHILFRTANNPMLRLADTADEWLARHAPRLSPYYRHCLIEINKQ